MPQYINYLQNTFLFAAVFAVQVVPEYDGPYSSVPPDLCQNLALPDVDSLDLSTIQSQVSGLGSLFELAFSNREKNLANLKNALPPTDFQNVNHAVKALDKAYETLKPAFPALTKSLTTLYKALPALSSVVSKYQKAVPQGTGPFSEGFYQEMFQFFSVVNDAL